MAEWTTNAWIHLKNGCDIPDLEKLVTMSRKKAVVKMINSGDEISKAVAGRMEDRCNKDVRTAKVEGRTKKNLDEDNMVKLEASTNGRSLATMIKNNTIKRNWMWKTGNV